VCQVKDVEWTEGHEHKEGLPLSLVVFSYSKQETTADLLFFDFDEKNERS
jgi:hypothetical protein